MHEHVHKLRNHMLISNGKKSPSNSSVQFNGEVTCWAEPITWSVCGKPKLTTKTNSALPQSILQRFSMDCHDAFCFSCVKIQRSFGTFLRTAIQARAVEHRTVVCSQTTEVGANSNQMCTVTKSDHYFGLWSLTWMTAKEKYSTSNSDQVSFSTCAACSLSRPLYFVTSFETHDPKTETANDALV